MLNNRFTDYLRSKFDQKIIFREKMLTLGACKKAAMVAKPRKELTSP